VAGQELKIVPPQKAFSCRPVSYDRLPPSQSRTSQALLASQLAPPERTYPGRDCRSHSARRERGCFTIAPGSGGAIAASFWPITCLNSSRSLSDAANPVTTRSSRMPQKIEPPASLRKWGDSRGLAWISWPSHRQQTGRMARHLWRGRGREITAKLKLPRRCTDSLWRRKRIWLIILTRLPLVNKKSVSERRGWRVSRVRQV
jgi:hypothetical protein